MNSFIKSRIKEALDAVLPFASYSCYSQCGEDGILRHYFIDRQKRRVKKAYLRALFNRPIIRKGFYCDVGAFSPKKWSNTYFLYRHGWRGITIEPRLNSSWSFRIARPRDIHLCELIGDDGSEVHFEDKGYSSVNKIRDEGNSRRCKSLAAIIEEHLPLGQSFDFLSIDCEGHDLAVLKSNDFSRFRPELICIEDHDWGSFGKYETDIGKFLESQGYCPYAWAAPSVFWKRINGALVS